MLLTASIPAPLRLERRRMGAADAAVASAQARRPRSVDPRRILTGNFHVLRSGCPWRLVPRAYGLWSTVYVYFRAWRRNGYLGTDPPHRE
jgi:transposase